MGDVRRWESGALAHGVSDPFGQGPLPWLRGEEQYLGDEGHVVPWYVDLAASSGKTPHKPHVPGPRTADDVRRQIKGFAGASAVAPGEPIDFRITVDPPQEFTVDVYRIGHYGGDGASHVTASPRLSGIVQPAPLAAGRTISCHHWWQSWRLQVPPHWKTGRLCRRAHHRRRLPQPCALHRAGPDGPRRSAAPAARRHLAGVQPVSRGRQDGREPLPRLGRRGPAAGRGAGGDHRVLRPPLRGRGPAPAHRPRLRLRALRRALRIRPRLRRRTRPARGPDRPVPLPRPGLPRPRRILVAPDAPARGGRRGTAAPRWCSCPPTPCTGRSTWPPPRPATRTAC